MKRIFFVYLFTLTALFFTACSGGDGGGETHSSSCYSAKSDIYKGNIHRTESVRYPQAEEAVTFIDNGSVIYTLSVNTADPYITLPDIRSAFCLHGRAGQILTGWDNASITYRPGAVYKVTGPVNFISAWDNGTEIYTADNLSGIRYNLTGIYKLMRDIDLSNFQSSSPTGWIPIGDNSSSTTAFSGKLYGNGYKVDNLSIDNDTGSVAGLFGALTDGAEVYDLDIALSSSGIKLYEKDVNKAAGALAGKITFYASTSTVQIENVHTLSGGIHIGNDDCATFLVTDRLSAGGLIGEVVSTVSPAPNLIIARSSNALNIFTDNSINVECESHLGGIIGAVNPDGSGYAVNLSIQESKNIGSVSAHRLNNDAHIGGALGYADFGGGYGEEVHLEFFENHGPIKVINSSSSGYASNFYAGGLVGHTYIPAYISDCVNNGIVNIVTDNIQNLSAGGLAGSLMADLVITRSCNKEAITAHITETVLYSITSTYAGGLSGRAQYSTASDNIMENCNEGNITARAVDTDTSTDARGVYAGGLFGYYSGDFDILNNSNSGDVLSEVRTASTSSYANADVKAGGIIGEGDASSFGSLTNNLNSGTVKVDASGFDTGTYNTYSGGIIGHLNNYYSTIVVDGNVSITSDTDVTVTPATPTGYRGLIAGGASATIALGTYNNFSVYSTALNEANSNITSGADGIGRPDPALHTQSPYSVDLSWDFTSSNAPWAWDTDNATPVLRWTTTE